MASKWATVFSYVPLVLQVFAIALHSLGIYLLSHVKMHPNSNQAIILINLSIAEIFMSCFDFTYNIMNKTNVSENISQYFYIVQCTGFVIPSFLILTFLALDRFLEVFLNIKYPIYITKRTTIKALSSCWIMGFILTITMILLQSLKGIDSLKYVFIVLFPFFEGFFLIVAAGSYTYIYIKFRKATSTFSKSRAIRRNNGKPNESRRPKQSKDGSNVFAKRKFFVPTLIIWTFILFALIPDQMHLFFFHVYDTGSDLLLNIILTLYVIGFICDGSIYILLQNNVKRLLMKKVLRRRSNKIHDISTSGNPHIVSST